MPTISQKVLDRHAHYRMRITEEADKSDHLINEQHQDPATVVQILRGRLRFEYAQFCTDVPASIRRQAGF